jgi:hypothetical protein
MADDSSADGTLDIGAPALFTPAQLARLRRTLGRTPYYCDPDTQLQFIFQGNVAGQSVSIFIRFQDLEGQHKNITLTPGVSGNRSSSLVTVQLGEGLLWGVTVIARTSLIDVGQLYARCTMALTAANPQTIATLFSGFCTSTQALSWPDVSAPNNDRPGSWTSVQGTAPAAGSEISFTIPTGARWTILALNLTLTCSAVVGNRRMRVFYQIGGLIPAPIGTAFVQTANNIGNYIVAPNFPNFSAPYTFGTYIAVATPFAITMQGGDVISTATDNLDVGDQWLAPTILYREELRVR